MGESPAMISLQMTRDRNISVATLDQKNPWSRHRLECYLFVFYFKPLKLEVVCYAAIAN